MVSMYLKQLQSHDYLLVSLVSSCQILMNVLYNWTFVSKCVSISMEITLVIMTASKAMRLLVVTIILAKVHTIVPNVQQLKAKHNLFTFIDINECEPSFETCEHLCTNNNGSFTCYCQPGYSITTDQLSCLGKILHHVSICNSSLTQLGRYTFQ